MWYWTAIENSLNSHRERGRFVDEDKHDCPNQLRHKFPDELKWLNEFMQCISCISCILCILRIYELLMNDSKITWLPIAANFCSLSKATAMSRFPNNCTPNREGPFSRFKIKWLLRNSAQWSRCQLGCSGSQNLPGSNYRRIICSCSYYMEDAKILL